MIIDPRTIQTVFSLAIVLKVFKKGSLSSRYTSFSNWCLLEETIFVISGVIISLAFLDIA